MAPAAATVEGDAVWSLGGGGDDGSAVASPCLATAVKQQLPGKLSHVALLCRVKCVHIWDARTILAPPWSLAQLATSQRPPPRLPCIVVLQRAGSNSQREALVAFFASLRSHPRTGGEPLRGQAELSFENCARALCDGFKTCMSPLAMGGRPSR